MESLIQDLRFAVRQLRRSRGTAIVAVVTLALGIGANTSMFTLLDALFFRLPNAVAPGRLVWLTSVQGKSNTPRNMSYPDYLDVRDHAASFSGAAGYANSWISLGGASPSRVRGEVVTPNYFDVLGARASLGRTFRSTDDGAQGANPVAILSDNLWRNRFDADPAIVGKTVVINGNPFAVVGVMPAGFGGVEMADDAPQGLWVPMSMLGVAEPGTEKYLTRRTSGWFRAFARLAPGATLAKANGELAVLAGRIGKREPALGRFGISSFPLTGGLDPSNREEVGPVVSLLTIVPALVLLVACANAANILLARGLARRKEIAVRRALGSSRARLVRQLLTESVLLSGVAGLMGVGFSYAMTALIARFGEIPPTIVEALTPNGEVLLATTAVAFVAGILFGLAPALAATRQSFVAELKSEGLTVRMGGRRHRLRDLFMVGQVAVSLVLLVTAGLFARSLAKSLDVDPGYATRSGVYVTFDLDRQNYADARQRAFDRDVLDAVRAVPGVQVAALGSAVPFGGSFNSNEAYAESAPTTAAGVDYLSATVTPAYFDALQIPVERGRVFGDRDNAESAPVVVVNETLARRLWPGQDALGKRLRLDAKGPLREVVGVVRDGKFANLTEAPRPLIWTPLAQVRSGELIVVARTSGDAASMVLPVTRAAQSLDPNLPLYHAQTIALTFHQAADLQRASASMLAVFGILALVLAALGMFSVTAHGVALRTKEIGIRMSLGAQRTNVMALFVREGLVRSMIGVAIGLAVSAGLSTVLASFLFGLKPTDLLTFAGGALVLCTVAAVASFIPSRRAARVDPLVALRHE